MNAALANDGYHTPPCGCPSLSSICDWAQKNRHSIWFGTSLPTCIVLIATGIATHTVPVTAVGVIVGAVTTFTGMMAMCDCLQSKTTDAELSPFA